MSCFCAFAVDCPCFLDLPDFAAVSQLSVQPSLLLLSRFFPLLHHLLIPPLHSKFYPTASCALLPISWLQHLTKVAMHRAQHVVLSCQHELWAEPLTVVEVYLMHDDSFLSAAIHSTLIFRNFTIYCIIWALLTIQNGQKYTISTFLGIPCTKLWLCCVCSLAACTNTMRLCQFAFLQSLGARSEQNVKIPLQMHHFTMLHSN